MTYRGHIENGAVVLDEPTQLADGMQVEVVVQEEDGVQVPEGRTLYARLQAFIGIADDMPSDSSQNLDHYLYRAPKA